MIGIYGIFDRDTDICLYVGQSSDMQTRWEHHRKRLRSGSHLQEFSDWFKSTGSDIEKLNFKVLEETEDSLVVKNEAEIKWFNELNPLFYGQVPSLANSGWKHAEVTRAKISDTINKKLEESGKVGYWYKCWHCESEFHTRRKKTGLLKYCSRQCHRDGRVAEMKPKKPRKLEYLAEKCAKEKLYMLYWVEMKNITTIAKELNTSTSTISENLHKWGIPVRGRGKAKTK